ncbi:MAG: copper resistance protein B [Gemmatimonadales bacterium]
MRRPIRVSSTGLALAAAAAVTSAPQALAAQEMDNAVFHYSRLAVDASSTPGANVGRVRAGGWVGTDFDRLWWSAAGERADGLFDDVRLTALYGHYVRTFWDLVVGFRQDVEPIQQSYVTFGIQGLAPYWFEVSLLASVSDRGRPSLRFEASTDLYLTQQLVLEPSGEIDLLFARDDEWQVGRGLRSLELGARLRYEVQRKLAPYVDLTWVREKEANPPAYVTPETDGLRLGVGVRLAY